VFEKLSVALGLTYDTVYAPVQLQTYERDKNIFRLPFDSQGEPTLKPEEMQELNLNINQKVRITAGPLKGKLGKFLGKDSLGNFEMRFILSEGGTKLRLGAWWIREALEGNIAHFPVVNV